MRVQAGPEASSSSLPVSRENAALPKALLASSQIYGSCKSCREAFACPHPKPASNLGQAQGREGRRERRGKEKGRRGEKAGKEPWKTLPYFTFNIPKNCKAAERPGLSQTDLIIF